MLSHITATGLVFVALSRDAPPFDVYFAGLEDLTNTVDFTKLPHRRSISYEGCFNWKTMSAQSLLLFCFTSRKIGLLTLLGSMATKNVSTASTPTQRSPNSTLQPSTPSQTTPISPNTSPIPRTRPTDSFSTSSPSAPLMSTAAACLLSALFLPQTRMSRGWNSIIITVEAKTNSRSIISL